MRSLQAAPILADEAELGESPVWDEQDGALWWIDWAQGIVFKSDLAASESKSFAVGSVAAAVALTPSGRVALATGHGFAELNPADGHVPEPGRAEPEGTATRMCDGKCDAAGRFWAGTLALDQQSPLGALFVMESNGRVRRVIGDVVISNGMCWSPDNTKYYYIDSVTQRVDVFDFDLEEGTITNRAPLLRIPPDEGLPDGLTIDSEGFLWLALWDGWQVRRYSPTGRLDTVIEMSVARPTCCALGGPNLKDLFITTAKPDGSDRRAAQPLAGTVFHVPVDVPGMPSLRCRHEL
jgi:sugar lactone lactonase YvrE